jgi:hypothetical protein
MSDAHTVVLRPGGPSSYEDQEKTEAGMIQRATSDLLAVDGAPDVKRTGKEEKQRCRR